MVFVKYYINRQFFKTRAFYAQGRKYTLRKTEFKLSLYAVSETDTINFFCSIRQEPEIMKE